MKRNLLVLAGIAAVVLTSVIWISCGGGGGGGGSSSGSSSTGDVALYITDDMSEDYKQVTVTVDSVRLVHTGTGNSCDVMTTPVTLDLTDLSSMIQLLDVTACPTANYNRIHIEFSEEVVVTDTGDITTNCKFTSYKDEGNKPNVIQCSGGSCSIDINGAVNVLANQNNDLALDFDLKEFEVEDFDSPDCSVTMKVSPLHADDIDDKEGEGYEHGICGEVSNLDTAAKSFTLTGDSGTFSVSYTNVVTAGIDNVLALSVEDNLKVTVKTATINLDTNDVDASAVYVRVEGVISDLDDIARTFTLTYPTENIIGVNYNSAHEVEGTLTNGASAEVKLEGYNGEDYLAKEVEVEEADD